MKKQRAEEEQREIADCRLQSGDSKIRRLETQTANPIGKLSTRAWGMVLIAALALIGCAFLLDTPVRDWITQHQEHGLKKFMNNVSTWGDWLPHVILGAVLLAAATYRKSRKWQRVFLAMLIACALAGIVARVIKIGTGRARPSVKSEQAWTGPGFGSKYYAFPSGHTAASTAFFATLAFASWRAGIWFLWVPALIAFSRMYVAAHYLSDVVCAAVLGMACAWFVWRHFAKRSLVG